MGALVLDLHFRFPQGGRMLLVMLHPLFGRLPLRLLVGCFLASLGMACTGDSLSATRDGSTDVKPAVGGTGGASPPRGSGGVQSMGGAGTGGMNASGGGNGAGGVVATGGTLVNSGSGGSGGSPGEGGDVGDATSAGGVGGSGVLDGASERAGVGAGALDGPSDRALGAEVSDGASERTWGFDVVASSVLDAGAEVQRDAASDTQANGCSLNNANDLIADFSTDGSLNPVDGRSGAFFVYGDGLGSFDPPARSNYPIDISTGNPACSGPGSFHVKATGFAIWGAAIAANFVAKPDGGTYSATYDASKYKGVSFWARGAAAIANVQVSFPDVYTDGGANPTVVDPTVQPCVYVSGSTVGCSPYLVKFADAFFPSYTDYQIDTTWKRFDILFSDTLQDPYNPGFHTSANKVDLHHLTGMAVQVWANYVDGTPRANDFEMWIDDVRFIE